MNFDGENLILTFRSDDKVIFEIFRVSGPVRLGVRDSIVLYEHEIKEELRGQRFGIKAYHHPGVLEALSATAPKTSCFRKLIRRAAQAGEAAGQYSTGNLLQNLETPTFFLPRFSAKRRSLLLCAD